jgi:hypothetical protein
MDANDKLNDMKCAECGYSDAEYYFNNEPTPYPLCKDCVCERLIDECNELVEIQNLEDDNEIDIEIINQLWEEQEHHHKDKTKKES